MGGKEKPATTAMEPGPGMEGMTAMKEM